MMRLTRKLYCGKCGETRMHEICGEVSKCRFCGLVDPL